MALDELSTQFNNYQNDNELMKKKLRELCDECGRLMQNLNTSNRLLYNVNKNKKRLETELDITVNKKIYINYYLNLLGCLTYPL